MITFISYFEFPWYKQNCVFVVQLNIPQKRKKNIYLETLAWYSKLAYENLVI